MALIKNLIGLDIGSRSVKLIKLRKIKDKIELEKARIIEFEDIKSMPQAVSNLLKSEKISSSKAAIFVSGRSVFTRFAKLPKISKKKIDQIVKYEAQQQIPFPIDKVIWDYQLFEDAKTSEVEIFLSAVKKDIIDNLYQQFSKVKELDIVSIQVAPIALYNILKFNGEIKDNSIVVDFGAKTTDLIITRGRQLWIRSIPMGGNDLTSALSKGLNLTIKEAENLKRKEGITLVGATGDENLTPRSDLISKIVNTVLSEFLAEISRSINYYKSQFDKTAVFKEVLLTGGASKIRYIERSFEHNLKIKTKRVNLLKKITINKYLKANLDEIEDSLGVALGLGLGAVYSPTIDINLISDERRKIKEFNKKKIYIFASEIVTLSIFLMLSFFYRQYIDSYKKEIAVIENESARYRTNQIHIGKFQNKIEDVNSRLIFLDDLIESKGFWLKIISVIDNIVPEEIWLTKLTSGSAADNIIVIEGKVTGSLDIIDNLENNLMKSGYFSEVEVVKADRLEASGEISDEGDFVFVIKMKIEDQKPLYSKGNKEKLQNGYF